MLFCIRSSRTGLWLCGRCPRLSTQFGARAPSNRSCVGFQVSELYTLPYPTLSIYLPVLLELSVHTLPPSARSSHLTSSLLISSIRQPPFLLSLFFFLPLLLLLLLLLHDARSYSSSTVAVPEDERKSQEQHWKQRQYERASVGDGRRLRKASEGDGLPLRQRSQVTFSTEASQHPQDRYLHQRPIAGPLLIQRRRTIPKPPR